MILFTPDIGVVVLTLSAFLIFFELNRPGLVISGTLGLLGFLLAANSLQRWQLSRTSLLLLLSGIALCLWELRRELAPAWMWLPAAAFVVGFGRLVEGPAAAHVHWSVAVCCGITLGTGASLLARIAQRARRNKGLN